MPVIREKDIICIVAPAGALKQEDIAFPIQILQDLGYQVELGAHLFQKYYYGYNYAGTPEQRAEDLQWALDHPKAKAIWFARGGYGGVQLLDRLDTTLFQNKPKWCIGYSDNTVFHQMFSLQGIPSIHGITLKPLSVDQKEVSLHTVLNILKSQPLSYQWDAHIHNQKGEIKASVSGGNLSILYSLLGSKGLDTMEGKILFIEDWQENWYHLDRMLWAMKRAHVFEGIKGLLVGSFTKMDDKEENKDYSIPFDTYAYQIISDAFREYDVPKAFGFSAGHINHNWALPLAQVLSLNISDHGCYLSSE